MSLLDLPTEIIALIVIQTIPLGLDSLALSCKLLCTISEPFVQEHNHLRRFRHFRFDPDLPSNFDAFHHRRILDPLGLLYHISKDLRIAHAIEIADLRTYYGRRGGPKPFTFRISPSQRKLVHDSIANLLSDHQSIWSEVGVDALWLAKAIMGAKGSGNLAFAESVLCALLPNVKTIALSPLWLKSYCSPDTGSLYNRLMEAIVRKANDGTGWPRGLSALRELLPTMDFKHQRRLTAMNSYQPFLALKTLKTAKITGCQWRRPPGQEADKLVDLDFNSFPGLEELELVTSAMNGHELSKLLVHMPRLRILRLDFEDDDGAAKGVCWDVGSVVENLGSIAGKQLQSLTLRMPDVPERLGSSLTELWYFEALQELDIDLAFFHPPRAEERHHILSMPPLSTTLPSSLERFRLRAKVGSPYRCDSTGFPDLLAELFVGFEQAKQTRLVSLKVAEICVSETGIQFRGFEQESQDFEIAIAEVVSANPSIEVVNEPNFETQTCKHDWPSWYP